MTSENLRETEKPAHPQYCVFNYEYTTWHDGQVEKHLSRGSADAANGEFQAARVENGTRSILGFPLSEGFGTSANIYAKLPNGDLVVENTPWTSPFPGFEDKHGAVFPYDPKTRTRGNELLPGTEKYEEAVKAVNQVRHDHEALPTAIQQYAPLGLGGLPKCELIGIPDGPIPSIKSP
jgi:hypothetical protein